MLSETEAFQTAAERLGAHLDKNPAPPGKHYEFADTMEVLHHDPNGLVRATVQARLVDDPPPSQPKPTQPPTLDEALAELPAPQAEEARE